MSSLILYFLIHKLRMIFPIKLLFLYLISYLSYLNLSAEYYSQISIKASAQIKINIFQKDNEYLIVKWLKKRPLECLYVRTSRFFLDAVYNKESESAAKIKLDQTPKKGLRTFIRLLYHFPHNITQVFSLVLTQSSLPNSNTHLLPSPLGTPSPFFPFLPMASLSSCALLPFLPSYGFVPRQQIQHSILYVIYKHTQNLNAEIKQSCRSFTVGYAHPMAINLSEWLAGLQMQGFIDFSKPAFILSSISPEVTVIIVKVDGRGSE